MNAGLHASTAHMLDEQVPVSVFGEQHGEDMVRRISRSPLEGEFQSKFTPIL